MKDDTISRAAAIDELERGKDKKAKGTVGGFYNQIIDNDIEKLRRLPSAQRWIPMSERLPEKDGRYLCSYGKHIHITQMINHHFRHYGEIADHLISAWMPLPEPWEGR